MKKLFQSLFGKEEPVRVAGKSGDVKPGFRELNWGDGVKPGFEAVDQDGDDKFYKRLTENLHFMGRPVSEIVYWYWQGKFRAVAVKMPGPMSEAVHKTLMLRYGQPAQPNPAVLTFVWSFGDTDAEATSVMLRKPNASGQDAMIIISSKAIEARRKQESAR